MPANGWYGLGNADTVADHGALWGWADQSGQHYGAMVNNPRRACSFGPVVNNYGTWGQLIYRGAGDLSAGTTAATGLNGNMPLVPSQAGGWVQGHLINADLGGDGSLACNLTPIGHTVNMAMKKYDNAVKRLVNADGSMIVRFNPNNIGNSRVIYRVHGQPPPPGTNPNPLVPHPFPTEPNGVVMSLGIVINGVMKTGANLQAEFNNPGLVPWFGAGYYAGGGNSVLRGDVNHLVLLVGGIALAPP